ncbi:MAG: hypothetical protein J6N49_02485 [Alphaproteobacteria bacterium]|nr:hypothetical protein [Alphaproteobacteria bacterium]
MEIDSGAPYFKAVVLSTPQQTTSGNITMNVRYRNRTRVFEAEFKGYNEDVMALRCGDEIWVAPCDGDILSSVSGPSIIRHNALVRWYMRNFG